MEQNNCLGIYLAKDRATAVVLSHKGSHAEVAGCFSVAREPHEGESESDEVLSLASMVARRLASERLSYGEVTVSLDCALYTQHNLHSDFADHRQIANTIAFDAEEALACDATEMALTFNVAASDENGSAVTVFTADRAALEDTLRQLQRESLDPTAIEPDIICLARYIEQSFSLPGGSNPLFVVLSDESCYIVNLQDSHQGPLVRSFILGAGCDLTGVLKRQIPLSIASLNPSRPIDGVFIADRSDEVDLQAITESTGLQAQSIDLGQMAKANPSQIADCASETDFAIAYAAALAEIKRIKPNDFRRSFAPYQGKRLILQRSLRAISIFATISLLALGIYFQLKVFRVNKYVSRINKKLAGDFAAVTYGKPLSKKRSISGQFKTEHVKLKNLKDGKGFGDERSVTAKLTYTLEALVGTPKSVNLNINTISVTRRVNISGDTNSRTATLAMLKSFKDKGKLEKTSERISGDRGRDKFEFTFDLKRATRGTRR